MYNVIVTSVDDIQRNGFPAFIYVQPDNVKIAMAWRMLARRQGPECTVSNPGNDDIRSETEH
jgi:hypothetical protein